MIYKDIVGAHGYQRRLCDLERWVTYGRLEIALQQVTLWGLKYRTCSMHRMVSRRVSGMRLATHS